VARKLSRIFPSACLPEGRDHTSYRRDVLRGGARWVHLIGGSRGLCLCTSRWNAGMRNITRDRQAVERINAGLSFGGAPLSSSRLSSRRCPYTTSRNTQRRSYRARHHSPSPASIPQTLRARRARCLGRIIIVMDNDLRSGCSSGREPAFPAHVMLALSEHQTRPGVGASSNYGMVTYIATRAFHRLVITAISIPQHTTRAAYFAVSLPYRWDALTTHAPASHRTPAALKKLGTRPSLCLRYRSSCAAQI